MVAVPMPMAELDIVVILFTLGGALALAVWAKK